MTFKAKLRRIGNSLGVIIPKDVITGKVSGDEIELDIIITKQEVITEKQSDVITPKKVSFNSNWCKKHNVYQGSCGCKL